MNINQAIVIDTKTAKSLIVAILGLKSEVEFLRKKITLHQDSLEMSTNDALEDLNDGRIVEFTNIEKALKYLHS